MNWLRRQDHRLRFYLWGRLDNSELRTELSKIVTRDEVDVIAPAVASLGLVNRALGGKVAIQLAKAGLLPDHIVEALQVVFHDVGIHERLDEGRAIARAELIAVMVNVFAIEPEGVYMTRLILRSIESRAGSLR